MSTDWRLVRTLSLSYCVITQIYYFNLSESYYPKWSPYNNFDMSNIARSIQRQSTVCPQRFKAVAQFPEWLKGSRAMLEFEFAWHPGRISALGSQRARRYGELLNDESYSDEREQVPVSSAASQNGNFKQAHWPILFIFRCASKCFACVYRAPSHLVR